MDYNIQSSKGQSKSLHTDKIPFRAKRCETFSETR